jgi:hypothetical protein
MVENNEENRLRLVNELMENIDYDLLWHFAKEKMLDDYKTNDDCFQEDWYHKIVLDLGEQELNKNISDREFNEQ